MNSSLTNIYWDTKLPIYKLSHSKLSERGITSLLIDVDGTLLSRNSNIIPVKVKNWITRSKEIFDLYLISNNPSEKRISKIGKELGIKYKYHNDGRFLKKRTSVSSLLIIILPGVPPLGKKGIVNTKVFNESISFPIRPKTIIGLISIPKDVGVNPDMKS